MIIQVFSLLLCIAILVGVSFFDKGSTMMIQVFSLLLCIAILNGVSLYFRFLKKTPLSANAEIIMAAWEYAGKTAPGSRRVDGRKEKRRLQHV